jgi:hypothetical protein
MLRSLLFSALLLGGVSLDAQSCETSTPELDQAIEAIHAAKQASADEAAKVVDELLPRLVLGLARIGELEDAWLHLGIDVSRQLVRLERKDEARRLLEQVAGVESDSGYKTTANEELAKLR